MRVFFDTEFMERGPGEPVTMLSIGLVGEDGRSYYAENRDSNPNLANEWVKENVFPHLGLFTWQHQTTGAFIWEWGNDKYIKPLSKIAEEVREFCGDEPKLYAYFADYDWVVLCLAFGRMLDLPKGWPMFCRDLKQIMAEFDLTRNDMEALYDVAVENPDKAHDALEDALWNVELFQALKSHQENFFPGLKI